MPGKAQLLPGLNPAPSVEPQERSEALAGREGLVPAAVAGEGLRVVLEADGQTPVAGLTLVFFGIEEAASAERAERWLMPALRCCLEGRDLPDGPASQAFLGRTDRSGLVLLPEEALTKFRRGMLIGASRTAYLARTNVEFPAVQAPLPPLLARSLAAVHLKPRFPEGSTPFPGPGVSAFRQNGNKAPIVQWARDKRRVNSLTELEECFFPDGTQWMADRGGFRSLFAFVGSGVEATAESSAAPSGARVTASVALPGYRSGSVEIPLVATGSPIQASIDLVPSGAPLGELRVQFSPPPVLAKQRHYAPLFLITLKHVTDEPSSGSSFCDLQQGSVVVAGVPPGSYSVLLEAIESGLELEVGNAEIRAGEQTTVEAPESAFAWVVIDPSRLGFRPDLPELTLSVLGRQAPEDWTPLGIINQSFSWHQNLPAVWLCKPGLEYRLQLDPPRFYDASGPKSTAPKSTGPTSPIDFGPLLGGQFHVVELLEVP
jgi:hypothetical protein